MASPGRMYLEIDMARYLTLPPDVRVRFDGWLQAEHLVEQQIVRLRLSEGFVVVEQVAKDDDGNPIVNRVRDELVYETACYPVRSLPPGEAFIAHRPVED